jgi:hypothetical protein
MNDAGSALRQPLERASPATRSHRAAIATSSSSVVVSAIERRNRFARVTLEKANFVSRGDGHERSDELGKAAENCIMLAEATDNDPKKTIRTDGHCLEKPG